MWMYLAQTHTLVIHVMHDPCGNDWVYIEMMAIKRETFAF